MLADAPIKDIHAFIGTVTVNRPPSNTDGSGPAPPQVEPLTVENVLWANTVLAAGSAVGFVIYTGAETRAVMNTSHPETKVGLLDLEINRLAKASCLDLLSNHLTFSIDLVCCDIRTLCRAGCVEWLPWIVVHLCIPVPYFILFHYSYQVSLK